MKQCANKIFETFNDKKQKQKTFQDYQTHVLYLSKGKNIKVAYIKNIHLIINKNVYLNSSNKNHIYIDINVLLYFGDYSPKLGNKMH